MTHTPVYRTWPTGMERVLPDGRVVQVSGKDEAADRAVLERVK